MIPVNATKYQNAVTFCSVSGVVTEAWDGFFSSSNTSKHVPISSSADRNPVNSQ